MVSRVIFATSAFSTTARKRGLDATSPPPKRAAVTISRINFVTTLARLASCFALRCFVLAHLE